MSSADPLPAPALENPSGSTLDVPADAAASEQAPAPSLEPLSSEALDQLIAQLDDGWETLPVEAIQTARQHRGQVTPRLIQVMHDATSRALAGEPVTGNAPFFALFLLTEFEAHEAVPAILESLTLSADASEALYGDAMFEILPRILALFLADRLDTLDEVILHDLQIVSADQIAGTASQTYLHLVRDGRLTREEAVQRLCRLLAVAKVRRHIPLTTMLVSELLDLVPLEAIPDLQEAFDLDLVDESWCDREELHRAPDDLRQDFERALNRCEPTGIADVIAELRTWAAYAPESDWSAGGYDDDPDDFDDSDAPPYAPVVDRLDALPYQDLVTTIHNDEPRVGRNDPCPCGSGKKFKKCCARN